MKLGRSPKANCSLLLFIINACVSLGAERVAAATCANPPSGLVSWWRAENNVADTAGANNGALFNGATFAPGETGQAFTFNGSNSYVEVLDSPSLRLTNELTIEFWVKRQRLDFASSPYADYVIEKGGDWTGNQ